MCDCVEKVNALMVEQNTVIDIAESIDFKTGKCRSVLLVPTVRLNSKRRVGPIRVLAEFCPMCGEKIPL
jgi:hypothetical protein